MAAAAVVLVLVAALGLGELVVRILLPQNLSGTWIVPSKRAYPVNKAGGGARHQSGQRVVHYRFNDRHLRGGPLDETADLKVLCLGDSFTFGWLVEEDVSFVGRLQASANEAFAPKRISFLNGGAGGWGAAHYVAFFEDYEKELKPDVVVVFLNFLDVSRSQASGLFRWKDADQTVLEAVTGKQDANWTRALARQIPGYPWLLEHSHLLQLARQACIRLSGTTPSGASMTAVNDGNAAVDLTKALFRRLNERCQERGLPLFVVSIGVDQLINQFAPDEWSKADRQFADQARPYFDSIKVPFLDLGESMFKAAGADPRRYFIPVDQHLNEEGNGLCAQLAWPWFQQQLAGILSASSRP